MKRKIDELGRIVIPKEIRKSLKLNMGDSLEIYIEDNKISLRKYS
ncbi:MAG: AbrB/MazE/SpoVT family DNA-binding domain-containing protein, partial [Bacilli bacterium]|nr:AbrB/MazE/SpoVT family DNA-binding domain-containing protein [Bacilli bacterium]